MSEYEFTIGNFIRMPERVYNRVQSILEEYGMKGQLSPFIWVDPPKFTYSGPELTDAVLKELNSIPGMWVD